MYSHEIEKNAREYSHYVYKTDKGARRGRLACTGKIRKVRLWFCLAEVTNGM